MFSYFNFATFKNSFGCFVKYLPNGVEIICLPVIYCGFVIDSKYRVLHSFLQSKGEWFCPYLNIYKMLTFLVFVLATSNVETGISHQLLQI